MPQQGRAALRHRARAHRRRAAGDRRDPARRALPRRAASTAAARGYVCENFGAPFKLPDLGPIGSNGLANPRDFLTPRRVRTRTASGSFELVAKFMGNLWTAAIDHSPLDVVAWHGNYAPYKVRPARASTRSARSASTIPIRRSSWCCSRRPTRPGVDTIDFVIFPPRMAGDGAHVPAAVVPPQRRRASSWA